MSQLQPLTIDVLNALAIEMLEHDALRDRYGLSPRNGRRVFHPEDLARGNGCCPVAFLDHDGNLTVRMES